MFKKIYSLIFYLVIICNSVGAMAQQSAKPWLGVRIDEGKTGVLVEGALPDTPASNSGIQAFDEIIKIDDTQTRTPRELIQAVTSKGIGHKVRVELIRGNKKIVKTITLVGRPDMLNVAKKALLGKAAPSFQANVIKGFNSKKIDLSQFKGELVLLDFWATWCPACVASYPRVIEFAKKYKKVKVIAISNEPSKVIRKFLDKNSVKINGLKNSGIVYIKSEQGKENIGQKYYSNSIPMFVLINKKGIVEDLTVGGGAMLEAILNKAVKLY